MQITTADKARLGTEEPFSGSPLPNITPPQEVFDFVLSYFQTYYFEDGDDERVAAYEKYKRARKQEQPTTYTTDELAVMEQAASRAKAREQAEKAHAAVRTRWWFVLPDGAVEVQGSSSAYITGSGGYECIKKGSFKRNPKTGKHSHAYCPTYQGGKQGSCYHLWMRELIRMAQVMTVEVSDQLERQKAA